MSLPISGFMPIPLAIMPPFMAYQSLVMGDAFGRAFQFGKRKISAMSNEEFNKLDVVTMFESISNEYIRMIPTVEKSMQASLELQVTIVKELLKTLPAIGQMLNELGIKATGKTLDELAHLIGMHFGHGEEGAPTPAPAPSPIQPPIEVPDTSPTESQKLALISDIQKQYRDISEATYWLIQILNGNSTGGVTEQSQRTKISLATAKLKLLFMQAKTWGMSGTKVQLTVYIKKQWVDGGFITIP